MGKCVVCNKSAGPFHELHKACLSTYQNTRKCLREKLADSVNSAEISSQAIEDLHACKSSNQFSSTHFKELFSKYWQEHAVLIVKESSLNLVAAKNLLHIADEFMITDKDVDDFLYTRLSNFKHLNRIYQEKPAEKYIGHVPEGIEFKENEYIIWQFEDTDKSKQENYSQQKPWTILNSLLDNMFMKSRYKTLDVRVEESGKLIVTNQGLFYLYKDSVIETKFSDVHSITPMKHGIRIQATQKDATADTYITGDGRFTYALLQYAQGKKD